MHLASFDREVTLNQLRVFALVLESKSFSRAAEKLGISQPSVSYQVKELEELIGADLFDRLGRTVEATEAGSLLYSYARHVLNLVDEAKVALSEVQGLRWGSLRVGASTTIGIYLIPMALGAFKQTHPQITIALEIGSRYQMQEALLRNELDVVVAGPPVISPDLVHRPFMKDRLVVIAAPGHRLAGRRNLDPSDLAEEAFILREPGSGTRATAEHALAAAGLTPQVGMELGSNGAIKHAVESGLGVAIISRWAITLELDLGRLLILDVRGFPLERQWNILYLRRRHLSNVSSAFVEFLSGRSWLPHSHDLDPPAG